MKIISARGAKNVLVSLLAINILAMQYYIPPFKVENDFELEQPTLEESKGFSRKLSKRKNNPNLKPKRYTFEG